MSWSVSVSWFSYVKPAVSSRSGQINRGKKKKKKDCAQERKRFQQSCMLWERRRKSNIHLICCLACDFFRCQNHGGACFHLKVNSALYLAASSAAHSEPGETIFSWLIRLHPFNLWQLCRGSQCNVTLPVVVVSALWTPLLKTSNRHQIDLTSINTYHHAWGSHG